MREMQALIGRKWVRDAASVVVTSLAAGTFFAVLGPFGSDRLGWPGVWLVWSGLIFAGSLFAVAAAGVVDRVRPDAPNWMWIATVALLISVGMTALLVGVEGVSGGALRFAADVPSKFLHVLVIAFAIVCVARLAEAPRAVARAPAAGPPAFLKRVPARLTGGELYAVSAEDHYLRVHTSRGDDLILMRLSDAIGELAPLEGLRVHRSWWVARAGVERVRRDGEKLILVLRSGAEAPVARGNVRVLKDAGWI